MIEETREVGGGGQSCSIFSCLQFFARRCTYREQEREKQSPIAAPACKRIFCACVRSKMSTLKLQKKSQAATAAAAAAAVVLYIAEGGRGDCGSDEGCAGEERGRPETGSIGQSLVQRVGKLFCRCCCCLLTCLLSLSLSGYSRGFA